MITILIVDDHADFRRRARALLEAEGFQVVGEAVDGRAGLEAARVLAPDLVLVDVGLPDMDGFEVTRRLVAEGGRGQIVLTSSREASSYGARLGSVPAIGFVPKDELSGAALRALGIER